MKSKNEEKKMKKTKTKKPSWREKRRDAKKSVPKTWNRGGGQKKKPKAKGKKTSTVYTMTTESTSERRIVPIDQFLKRSGTFVHIGVKIQTVVVFYLLACYFFTRTLKK